MELTTMSAEELLERRSAIGTEIDADGADLDALEAEARSINEELERRQAEETKKNEIRGQVANGAGQTLETAEPETRKDEKMSEVEVRKSPEYLDAWVEYQKGTESEEQRALLTTNATNGTIAVPTYVEDTINTAWESNEIMRRVKRSYFKGNLKVGYEASAGPASMHTEGGNAVTEEELVIGYVELIPTMIKKLVRYSDEVLDMKGQAFVDYVFDEIEYQIVKLAAEGTVGAVIASSLCASSTLAGTDLTTADIITAEGLLGAEATNPVLITTRQTAAALKAAALSAHYGYDPFDGLEVLYTSSTALGTAAGLIIDLSGVQANFPDGDAVKFKFDDITEAAADMVRVIGRIYAALDLVAPGKAVALTKQSA